MSTPASSTYAELFGTNSVTRYLPQGVVGALVNANLLDQCTTLVNKSPQAQQVWTVTISTATNGATYTLSVGGVAFAYVATSATDTVIASGMAAAFNLDRNVASMFSARASSATVILTATDVGISNTVSTSDSKMSVALTTSPATANPVAFGDVVIPVGGQDDDGTLFGTCVDSSLFTAQAVDLAITYAASETYSFTLSLYGVAYSTGPILADTNSNTTATAVRAALTAALSGIPVTVSGATNHAIITSNLAGIGFELSYASATGGHIAVSSGNLVSTAAQDFNKVGAGIATLANNQPSSTVGVPGQVYVANSNMTVAGSGVPVLVYSEQTVLPTDSVYVELTAGASAGLCYNDSSSTRVKWVGAKWRPKAANNAAGFNLNQIIPA